MRFPVHFRHMPPRAHSNGMLILTDASARVGALANIPGRPGAMKLTHIEVKAWRAALVALEAFQPPRDGAWYARQLAHADAVLELLAKVGGTGQTVTNSDAW